MTRKLTAPPGNLDPVWSYEATPGFYDEVLGTGKQLRPHWEPLSESLTGSGQFIDRRPHARVIRITARSFTYSPQRRFPPD